MLATSYQRNFFRTHYALFADYYTLRKIFWQLTIDIIARVGIPLWVATVKILLTLFPAEMC